MSHLRLLPLFADLMALFALIFASPLAADVEAVNGSEPAPDANGKLCGYSAIQEGGFVVELYTNPCTDADQAEHFQTIYNKYCTLCIMFTGRGCTGDTTFVGGVMQDSKYIAPSQSYYCPWEKTDIEAAKKKYGIE
ncbi:uncharacterized protein CC84DRAFT_1214054 [Paraphaeosphaeria sporulosa]|uniref:Uncharacterized protein n=1 Tax=Paraphaeosphaeria sporulosa TaxID=1460663 RepID=A0A177CVE0_9PLEO|nr:uncharacterized protein CC84DRAFT_1214054 [Paraphaeosphaeria sporulosa]OAG10757.1 hypothetical protein CC84DRAFT_1214054 [Paraphaeosphaeria sporulosa]